MNDENNLDGSGRAPARTAASPLTACTPRRRWMAWMLGATAGLMLGGQPAWTRAQERPGATGVVTHVTDGDTLWVRLDAPGGQAEEHRRRPIKLRLQGIDAPERCQAWGAQAQAALAGRVLKRRVQLLTRGQDDYGRVLGNVLLLPDGEDVSAWMVGQGHAWSYRHHRSPGPYAAQEQSARQARKGLFADAQAIEPRVFRKTHGSCADLPAGPG